jgi:hypothetical protein
MVKLRAVAMLRQETAKIKNGKAWLRNPDTQNVETVTDSARLTNGATAQRSDLGFPSRLNVVQVSCPHLQSAAPVLNVVAFIIDTDQAAQRVVKDALRYKHGNTQLIGEVGPDGGTEVVRCGPPAW